MSSTKKLLLMAAMLILSSCATTGEKPNTKDATANSVKVTNMSMNHGGTGVILASSPNQSLVLTNSHVCGVVEDGGMVLGNAGKFMVMSYKKSEMADLCLVRVAGDLHGRVKIATRPPVAYKETALISGHPSLYPNVKTRGHFSGRESVPIMLGFAQCTEDDMKDPDKAAICMLTGGGLPIIKNFDSVLVTATIMPGSSGSAVYNKDMELSGLVFAGSGELGYAWTVPYSYVRNFLFSEAKNLEWTTPSNKINLFGDKSQKTLKFEEAVEKLQTACQSSEQKRKFKQLCDILQSNLIM